MVWVNSWFDPAKEQEAAKALMAQGCDVIFSNAQDTPSVISACEEAGVYAFNLNFLDEELCAEDLPRLRRHRLVALLQGLRRCHVAGTFKGANAFLGMSDKVVAVVDWNTAVPARP